MTGALAWQVTHHLNKTIIFVFWRGDRMGNCPGSPLCCPCPAFSYFSLTYDPCLRSRCPFARHSSLAINSHLLHDVAIYEADSKWAIKIMQPKLVSTQDWQLLYSHQN